MASINIAGDTSGVVTLQAPSVAGSTTLNLPATSGSLMVNGPAFSAYATTAPTIANNTSTKIVFDAEQFDTDSCYNTSLYRFTPNITGYYFITITLAFNATATNVFSPIIYKNGAQDFASQTINAGSQYPSATTAKLIYMNGSTDYLEAYIYQNSGGTGVWLANRQDLNVFQGYLVRSA